MHIYLNKLSLINATFFLLPVIAGVNATPIPKAFGVSTHVIGQSKGAQKAQLDLMAQAHINSVRIETSWKYVETTRGQYTIPAAWDQFVNEALHRGIQPVLILDYGNQLYDNGDKPRSKQAISGFINYASFVVKHFQKRVNQYEVWNEWDNHTGGFPAGSPEDYANLFKPVYSALKSIAPSAKILVGAGVRPGWYERLSEIGLISESDGVAVHPYNYQKPDSIAPERIAIALNEMESKLSRASNKSSIDLYVTEIGWPTNTGRFGYPEATVGAYAARTLLLLSSLPFVKGVWWYDMAVDDKDPTDKESRFGLVRSDLSIKPAYKGIATAALFAQGHELTLNTLTQLNTGLVAIDAKRITDDQNQLLIWN